MRKLVFISGASSGIGRSTAHVFAQNNYDLILAARRTERLNELKKELEEKYKVLVHCLSFDVQKRNEVEQTILTLPKHLQVIDILVNNAGLSLGLDPIDRGEVGDWERMIDTNVKGLLYVSKTIMPFMIERKKGHIINIGSIAGKETYANGNVYCATKHAVDSLSKAMRIDLLNHGIKVSAIHPGAVETEFSVVRFKGDEQRAKKVYEGFEALNPDDIAEAVYFMASRPAHVNINDMVIMPEAQANAGIIRKK